MIKGLLHIEMIMHAPCKCNITLLANACFGCLLGLFGFSMDVMNCLPVLGVLPHYITAVACQHGLTWATKSGYCIAWGIRLKIILMILPSILSTYWQHSLLNPEQRIIWKNDMNFILVPCKMHIRNSLSKVFQNVFLERGCSI